MSKPLPKLDLNITNRCNFRCIHCCFNSGETMLREFSLDKIKDILKEFKTLGGERIDITGGEPLLRPDLPEIIKIGKDLNLKIELVTNGSLLTDEKLKLFKQLGLDAIAISLDGSNYETYKKIRPIKQETYNLIIQNIQKSISCGFPVKINTVIFNSNLDDLSKINALAIRWGAKEHGFYYFTPVGRGATSSTEVVDPTRWLAYIRQTLLKSKDKIKLSLETPLLESNLAEEADTSCYLKNPWHLQILPDGNVYPCAIMAFYNRPCGNLRKQTLTEIWNDEKLWNGDYYNKNVVPLFKKFGGCVCFNEKFKQSIDSEKFKFICLMCKLKTTTF